LIQGVVELVQVLRIPSPIVSNLFCSFLRLVVYLQRWVVSCFCISHRRRSFLPLRYVQLSQEPQELVLVLGTDAKSVPKLFCLSLSGTVYLHQRIYSCLSISCGVILKDCFVVVKYTSITIDGLI